DRLSPEDDFAELKIFARNTGVYRPEDWFIAYYKRRPIGFTLPQCHDRKNRSGSNFYVGVIPEMRNKGFGKALQYFAVQKLKERGIKTIVGSTVPANRPMKRIFKSLGYRLELIQYFYIPAKEG
ncbi:MAG: GNAT family N-acetyltransferase, partial [candidate division WOR-3 bacterium]